MANCLRFADIGSVFLPAGCFWLLKLCTSSKQIARWHLPGKLYFLHRHSLTVTTDIYMYRAIYTHIHVYIYTYVCMYMHIRAIHTNIHIVEYVWWRPPLPDLLIAYLVVSRVQSAHVCIYSIHVCIYMYLAFMYLCIYIYMHMYTCTVYIYKRIFSLFSAKSNITEPSVAMNTELENAKNHLQGVSW